MLSTRTPLPFTVTRQELELIAPAKATPGGFKPLSEIDEQSLRVVAPLMLFYSGKREDVLIGDVARDPVRVIREALAEALVYYYPLAGRLRESGPGGKLVVDCTGEGVLFVEAVAGYTVEDLLGEGEFLRPPFPCELQYDVPAAGSSGILNCPLLFIQVTRFLCGGFSLALHMNHTMSEAAGLVQFMNCVAELARGASRPSVQPVWSHELFLVGEPPRVTCTNQEYHQVDGTVFPLQYINDRIIERSFFFGPAELSAIRRRLQPHLRRCNTIELLSAFLWRCRTIALRFDPSEEVRYIWLVNVRPKHKTRLPTDYCGNAFVVPEATSTAGELSGNSLDYAVELIKKAKEADVTKEYMRSVMDLMATSGRSPGTWIVSGNTHAGHLEIDFGWGKPEFAGPSSAMVGAKPGLIGFFVKGVNGVGASGVFLLICLPVIAMEGFAREVRSTIATSRL